MGICDAKSSKNQEIPMSYDYPNDRQAESGSAIVWIFVMIALLAALTFTFSSGSRTGQQNLSRDKIDLIVTEILDYSELLARATQTLRINGCNFGDGGLTFYSDQFNAANDYNIPNSPTDNSCHIFHPNGGGVIWKKPPKELENLGQTEYYITSGRGVSGLGTTGGDAGIELTTRILVTREICLAINKKFNIPEISGSPPQTTCCTGVTRGPNSPLMYSVFNVTAGRKGFINNFYIGQDGHANELFGFPTGCHYNDNDDTYEFYHVLAVR